MSGVIEKSSLYKERYGNSLNGAKPNYKNCCENVVSYGLNWPRYYQCSRSRGHGPDGAYCKQHDPEVVKARLAKSSAKYIANWNKKRYEIHGHTFFRTLQKIAEGHNDARGLAQQVIDEFKSGESK